MKIQFIKKEQTEIYLFLSKMWNIKRVSKEKHMKEHIVEIDKPKKNNKPI